MTAKWTTDAKDDYYGGASLYRDGKEMFTAVREGCCESDPYGSAVDGSCVAAKELIAIADDHAALHDPTPVDDDWLTETLEASGMDIEWDTDDDGYFLDCNQRPFLNIGYVPIHTRGQVMLLLRLMESALAAIEETRRE